MFLAGFVLGFLIFYVFSPLIFKTQLCCGPNGKEIGQWLLSKLKWSVSLLGRRGYALNMNYLSSPPSPIGGIGARGIAWGAETVDTFD